MSDEEVNGQSVWIMARLEEMVVLGTPFDEAYRKAHDENYAAHRLLPTITKGIEDEIVKVFLRNDDETGYLKAWKEVEARLEEWGRTLRCPLN